MNINIENSYQTLLNCITDIKKRLEPLQDDNYDIRLALTNAKMMYVTAKNILDEYKELKEE